MIFYRANLFENCDKDGVFNSPEILFDEFDMIKETPKGYWIDFGRMYYSTSGKKWISKTSKKKYAYLTKKEALDSLIKRSEKRIKILEEQLRFVKLALNLANYLEQKDLL